MNSKIKLNKIFSKAALILGLLIILPQGAFAAPSVVTNSDSGDTKDVTVTLDPTYESEAGAPSEINYESYSSDGYKGTLKLTGYTVKEYDLKFDNVPNYGTKENDHRGDIFNSTYPDDNGGWEHETGKGFRDYSQVTKVSKYYPDDAIDPNTGIDYGNKMIWTYGDSTGQSSYTVKDSKGRYGDTVDPDKYYRGIGRSDLASDKDSWHLYNYGFNASLGQYWLTAGYGSKSFTQHSNVVDVNGRSHNIAFTGELNLTDWDRYNVMGFPHADDSQYNNPYNADPQYGSNYAAGATMSDIPIYSGKLVGYLYAPAYSGTVTKKSNPTPTPPPTPAQPGDVTVHCMDKDTHEVIAGSPTFTVTPSNNTIEISSSQIPTISGYTVWATQSFPYSRYNGVDMMSSGGHISRTYTQGVDDIYILYKSAGGDNPSPTPTPTPKSIGGNGAEVKYIDEDAHYEIAWSDHLQSGTACNFTPHLGSDNNAMPGYRIETNDNGSYKSYLSPGIIYCVDDSGSRDFNSPKSSGDSSIISLSADETTSDKVIYIFCTKKAAPVIPTPTPVAQTGTVIKRYFKDGSEDTSAEQIISDVTVGSHTYDVDRSYDGYKCSNPSVTVDVTANDTVYCDFEFSRQNHPPVVTLNLPETVTLGDDLDVVAYASDPDGDKLTLDWPHIPEGMSGTLKDIGGSVHFDNPNDIGKEKTFNVTATDPYGATGSASATVKIVAPVPTVSINTSGTLKENRKVSFSSTSNGGSKRFPIDDTKTTWQFIDSNGNILAVDSNPTSDTTIKSLSSTTGVSSFDTIIKKAGTYTVKCTVTNTYGKSATDTKSITIEPDLAPTADFSFQDPNGVLRDPDNNNRSTFIVNDNSSSSDNDIIDKRIWFYAFDSDNDGDIDDETWYVFKDGAWSQFGTHADVEALIDNPAAVDKINGGNLTTIKLSPENFYNNGQMQSHVGEYYFREIVREKFGQDTIQNLVTIKDYKLNIR